MAVSIFVIRTMTTGRKNLCRMTLAVVHHGAKDHNRDRDGVLGLAMIPFVWPNTVA